MKRRLRLALIVASLAAFAAVAALWARSHWRRDVLGWTRDRPGERRLVCRAYSSRGQLTFLSYSSPVGGESGTKGSPGLSLESGAHADTDMMAAGVGVAAAQAGLVTRGSAGFGYGQHVGVMSSGVHVWTAAAAPHWAPAALALVPAAWIGASLLRPRRRPADEQT